MALIVTHSLLQNIQWLPILQQRKRKPFRLALKHTELSSQVSQHTVCVPHTVVSFSSVYQLSELAILLHLLLLILLHLLEVSFLVISVSRNLIHSTRASSLSS